MKNSHFNLRIHCLAITIFIFNTISAIELGQGNHAPSKPEVVTFIIQPTIEYQTIDNFSASDGWSMQYIGLWPENKKAQMADWLFSTENDKQGKPKGIGLSMWRFNVGAGSAEQAQASQIGSEWTRTECFLLPNGNYDWTKQEGQRNFLKLAKQRGVNQFLAFILSAPVYWTQNGLATNTGRGGTFNLKQNHYNDFAVFMANVLEGLEKEDNIKFNYISPFNEPDGAWNWLGPKQEGTPATNQEIARTVKLAAEEFSKRKINTKILITESSDYNCMFSKHPNTNRERCFQIQSFFNPDSTQTYLGNTTNVPKLMAAHSYWTNTPLSNLRKTRIDMDRVLKKHKVGYWQTELCIMSNDEEIGGGGEFDKSMKTALYVARIIHHDLVYANASAWQWWRAVATSDYKDGLIRSFPDKTLKDGSYTDSKLMWVLGNYSRFIRPGAKRIAVVAYNKNAEIVPEGDTDPYALMVSAYKNRNGKMVVVVINYHVNERIFNIQLATKSQHSWTPYCTSDNEGNDLVPMSKISLNKPISIPGRTIITYLEN